MPTDLVVVWRTCCNWCLVFRYPYWVFLVHPSIVGNDPMILRQMMESIRLDDIQVWMMMTTPHLFVLYQLRWETGSRYSPMIVWRMMITMSTCCYRWYSVPPDTLRMRVEESQSPGSKTHRLNCTQMLLIGVYSRDTRGDYGDGPDDL